MVDQRLLDETHRILGDRSRKILITGGTGFVGSQLARCLAEAGHDVTALGRNKYRTHRTNHPNIRLIQCDIRDTDSVVSACERQELVYHAAALTSPWGSRKLFQQINVEGTRNIVLGCTRHAVQRLVHVSSTSIFFDFKDMLSQSDDAPYASPQACAYSESKRDAERVVFEANRNGLFTFTVRARAVFGVGDSSMFPRLIEAAKSGRLRQIGNGDNYVDLTYIDNLVLALVLAAERGRTGGICTITNGEPVLLWKLLPEVFERLGIRYRGKQISYRLLQSIVSVSERIHQWIPMLAEPKLTRYTVGLLAKNQVFDLTAARRDLAYRPIVTMREGIERTIDEMRRSEIVPAMKTVSLRCFTTGYAEGNRRFVERTSANKQTRFHTLVGLVEHPTMGLTLFDTGYAPRLLETSSFSGGIYRRVLPVATNYALAISSQLRELGIEPGDISRVLISHFHPDHIAGLKDFPKADFIASQTAWRSIRNRKGLRALRYAYLPELLPADFEKRLHLIESFADSPRGTLGGNHDLFGDGSIRLFELPGHAAGQMGALLQTSVLTRDFLVADAAWTSSAIREQVMPHAITRSFVHSFVDIRQTLGKLSMFSKQFPDDRLLPTHCPEVAFRYEFDQLASRLLNG